MAEFFGTSDEIAPHVAGTQLQAPFDYWQELRGNQPLPGYDEFDPMRIARNLSRVLLIDCLPGNQFRYKLGGDDLAQRYQVDSVAGMTPEEVFGKKAKNVTRPYRRIRETGSLFFRSAERDWVGRDPSFVAYKVLLMPFGGDGGDVDKILAAFDFDRD